MYIRRGEALGEPPENQIIEWKTNKSSGCFIAKRSPPSRAPAFATNTGR